MSVVRRPRAVPQRYTPLMVTPSQAARLARMGYNAVKAGYKYARQKVQIKKEVRAPKRESSKVGGITTTRGVQGMAGTARAVIVKGKHKKRNGIPRVRVGPLLKKQIKQTIEERSIRGEYQVTLYGTLGMPATNEQNVTMLNDPYFTSSFFSCFSAQMFLHYASVLWNQKDNADIAVFANSIGYTDISGSDVQLPVDNVSSKAITAKFHVVNSYEMRSYKNNSERTVYLDIYLSEPKAMHFENQNSQDTNGTTINMTPTYSHPTDMWSAALYSSNKSGGNVNNSRPTVLHTTPFHLHMFTTAFKTTKVSVVLEPGQRFQHKVEGPKNTTLDFQKFYKTPYGSTEAVFHPIQKFSRYCWYVVKQDLVQAGTAATNGLPGRVASTASTSPNIISCERVIHVSMTIPESVGGKVNGQVLKDQPAALIQNIARLPKFFYFTYNPAYVQDAVLRRVDEQNADDENL